MNLQQISKIVKNNNAIPITTTVLIDAHTMTGTNLETYIIQKHNFKVVGVGCVNFAKLKGVLDKLKTIDLIEFIEGNKVNLVKGGSTITLSTEAASEFPPIPKDFEDVGTFDFKDDFKKAQKFVGKDDLNPKMQAVYIDHENIVGCDGKVMFYKKHNQKINCPIYVGADLFFMQGDYKISKNEGSYFKFEKDDVTLIYRGFDEDYVDYKTVIREKSPIQIGINKADFKEAIELALLTSNKYKNSVTLDTNLKQLASEDLDYNSESKINLVINPLRVGDDIIISFDGKRMLNVISVLSDTLVMDMETTSKAIHINNEVLIMPYL